MGSHRRRQLQFDIFEERAFPYNTATSGNDGGYGGSSTQGNALSTPTDGSQTISTSIALGGATTETINGSGDTLSLVVVSTVYGEPVNSYSATSSSLPSTTSSQATSTSTSMTSAMSSSPTHSSAPTSNPASAGESTNSPTPVAVQHQHHTDLSKGELAAAIVVPIVVVLALGAFLFLCFRRRKQSRNGSREGSLRAAFIPASIKDKWSSMRTSNASAPQEEPVVMNTRNNAYNTGLDTSSYGSGDRSGQHSGEYTPGRRSEGGTTFDRPPPPYLPAMRQNTPLSMPLDFPRSPQPAATARDVSPHTRTPLHDTPSAAALLAMPLDPPQPSSRSARSITSTLYSDTASVHSARAARMSVGGPHVIQSQQSRSGSGSDPFDTGANTPVTPLSTREDLAERR